MPTEQAIIDAYTRRALLLLRVGAGFGEDAIADLRKLARTLRGLIAGSDLSALGRRELAALLREVETAITDAYAGIAQAQAASLAELAAADAAWASDQFGARAASVSALDAALAAMLVLGYPLAKLWQRQGAGLADRTAATIRTAAAMQTPVGDVLGAVLGQSGRGGLFEQARNQAATLADTSAHAAAYAARQAAWKSAGVQYLKWHSILDQRTTIGCAVRAGKLYTLDFQPVGHDIPIEQPPPRHWNCRSLLAPMAPDFVPLGDGQDPYTESLDAWLKRQPESVQNELLGPTRAALWRAGKLDARGLLGRGGETLSVAELKALHPDSAYDIAKAGGNYVDFLAEREKYTNAQLQRSARSYGRTIAQHESWIADPYLKLPPDATEEQIYRLVNKKWPGDIRRNRAYLAIVEGIMRSRK